MSEQSPEFRTAIDAEKRERATNLATYFDGGKWPDDSQVREFFASRNVNPDTVAELYQKYGAPKGRLEGNFPQIRLETRADEITAEILAAMPEGFKNPEQLLTLVCAYVKHKMSYDSLTVMFNLDPNDESAIMARMALKNPEAKFAISPEVLRNLQSFMANLQVNALYLPEEKQMMTEIHLNAHDKNWIADKLADPKFRQLIQKMLRQSGRHIHDASFYGILRTNESVSRDAHEVLNTVKVGVCRDFAMLAKRIYEKLSPNLFPDSEAIYVSNLEKRHAYLLLAYQGKDGKMVKKYFDPTSFITGGGLGARENGSTYGNKKEVWADAGASADEGVA